MQMSLLYSKNHTAQSDAEALLEMQEFLLKAAINTERPEIKHK